MNQRLWITVVVGWALSPALGFSDQTLEGQIKTMREIPVHARACALKQKLLKNRSLNQTIPNMKRHKAFLAE